MAMRWYVVHAYSGFENRVKQSLIERVARSEGAGFGDPRWSQATERRIGSGLFAARIPTQMFNGYGEQVAHLYEGLDLRKNY